MLNNKIYKKLTIATGGFSVLAIMGAPLSTFATTSTETFKVSSYSAHLSQLNNSGVSGKVRLNYQPGTNSDTLVINLNARGTTPNQTHPVHIHGKDHLEVAFCPSTSVDTNNDGFVSVIEGAATYGPIKLNLTTPQTPFGAGPSAALFTPFAGTPSPSNAFPMANSNGKIHLNEKYVFDSSSNARGALASLTPLEDQHIVVHGAMAPASVDADAFKAIGSPVTGPLEAIVYDALLPVACGEIQANDHKVQSHKTTEVTNAVKHTAKVKKSNHDTNIKHSLHSDIKHDNGTDNHKPVSIGDHTQPVMQQSSQRLWFLNSLAR